MVVFYNSCNITDEVYRVGGGGVDVGGGWEAEGRQYHPQGGNSSAVSLVGHRNCHSQPGKTRRSSAAV